jgi:RNA-binding protein
MPSSPLRRRLRAAGHHLAPIVQVGKEGLTDAVVRQLDEALAHHELVKLKVGTESPEDRFEVAEALGGRAGAQIAQILGRTVLAYRRHPEEPRYEAAPEPPAGRGERGAARAPGRAAGRSRKPAGRWAKPGARPAKPGARSTKPGARSAKPGAGKRPRPAASEPRHPRGR